MSAEPVRVGLLLDRWQPTRGGAERAFDQLAHHLTAAGHQVHRFAREEQGRSAGTFHRLTVHGLTRAAREIELGRHFQQAARDVGCDVTVGLRHLEQVDLLWLHGGAHRCTLAGRRRSQGRKGPNSFTPSGRHRLFEELERRALAGGARRVVVPSFMVRDELRALYPEAAAEIEVVEPGIDLTRFHPKAREEAGRALRAELGLDPDSPLLVMPAAQPRLKGLIPLLSALEHLPDPPHLCVAGPRRKPGAFQRSPLLRSGRLHWRTHLDPMLLAAGADRVVLPTWRDTFGLALVEALAAGSTVLTSRFAGAAARVAAGGGVVLDDPGDVEALAAGLCAPRPNPDLPRGAVLDLDLHRSLTRMQGIIEELALS